MNVTKLIVVSLVMLSMTAMTFGQTGGQGSRSYDRCYRYRPLDITAPQSIEGKVIKVEAANSGRGRYGDGTHLVIQSGKAEMTVHLGPRVFLEKNQIRIQQGDQVKLTAFKGTYNNQAVFFASQVWQDGKAIILRDQQGFPMWRASLEAGGRGNRNRSFRRGGNRDMRGCRNYNRCCRR